MTDLYVSSTSQYKTIQEAADVAQPGDIVHVLPGIYTSNADTIVWTQKSGTSAKPITFVSETLHAAKIVSSFVGHGNVWYNSADYIIINGFEMSGGNGISGLNSAGQHCQLLDNYIHDIQNTTCLDGPSGIVSGGNTLIMGNVINNYNVGGSCPTSHGIYGSAGDSIEQNIVSNISGYGIHVWGDASNSFIKDNLCFRCEMSGILIGNDSGTCNGSSIIDNISVYNKQWGIREYGSIGSNIIDHNLLYGNGLGTDNLLSSDKALNTMNFAPPFINYRDDGLGDYHTPELTIGPYASTPVVPPSPQPLPLPLPGDTGIGLFVGVESFSWTKTDFDACISFCKQNNINQIVLKVYEITQGFWYKSLSFDPVVYIRSQGIDVLPYGFFYGNDIPTEVAAIHTMLAQGRFCLDMESHFNNNPTKTQAFHDALINHAGILYVSTWANPVTQGWDKNIAILDDIVSVWMPQAYSDSLVKDMYSQFPKVQGNIWPTFHVIDTPFRDAQPYQHFTLWEYQDARNAVTEVQQYVLQQQGKPVMTYPTNSQKMIANYLPVSEFQPGHSEFECGAFAVALNQRATNAPDPNHNSSANLIAYAEYLYQLTTGSNDSSNTVGASINAMHTMLKNTQSYTPPGLHWWDITAINPTSQQEHDIATIKAALQHGYPVIATVSESSVFDLDLGRNPYWWGPTGNHILTWVGIASDGNLLAVDPANVLQGDGNLQSPKIVQPWPRKYDIRRIANQWATIVQMPWLPPIPNNDPLSWSPYQSPPAPVPVPVPDQSITVTYDPNSKQLIFMNGVIAIYRIQL